MGPSTIAKRVARLRLAKSELSRTTNLHENTIARALSPEPKVLTSTQRTIEEALAAEELALRDYLLDLHPLRSDAVPA